MTCRSGRRGCFSRNRQKDSLPCWRQCCNLEMPEEWFFQVWTREPWVRVLDQPKPWGPVRQLWVRRGHLRNLPWQEGLQALSLVPCTRCTWDMVNLTHSSVNSILFVSPELCDNSVAGSSASQCKEEVIVLLVEHRAWPWEENLEGKFFPEERDWLTLVFSGVTSAILPSAKTTRMLRICSAP